MEMVKQCTYRESSRPRIALACGSCAKVRDPTLTLYQGSVREFMSERESMVSGRRKEFEKKIQPKSREYVSAQILHIFWSCILSIKWRIQQLDYHLVHVNTSTVTVACGKTT